MRKQGTSPGKPGRPSKYSDNLAFHICERLANGESLVRICKDEGMPGLSTVFRWLSENETFRDSYVRAREVQADVLADEILEISDDGTNDTYVDEEGRPRTDYDVIARSKLRVDARKWIAAKLKPKTYGDRQQVDATVTTRTLPASVDEFV